MHRGNQIAGTSSQNVHCGMKFGWILLPKDNYWHFKHVRSHRDVRLACSDHDAWCISHNGRVDDAAKQIHMAMSQNERQCLSLANMEFKRIQAMSTEIFKLQQAVLQTPQSGQQLVAVRHSQPFHDSIPITMKVSDDKFTDSLLCPGFLWRLRTFLTQQWHACPSGFSILECYLPFVQKQVW